MLTGDRGCKEASTVTAPPLPSPQSRIDTHFSSHPDREAGPVLNSNSYLALSMPTGLGSTEAAPSHSMRGEQEEGGGEQREEGSKGRRGSVSQFRKK